jgi:hypothetical protein
MARACSYSWVMVIASNWPVLMAMKLTRCTATTHVFFVGTVNIFVWRPVATIAPSARCIVICVKPIVRPAFNTVPAQVRHITCKQINKYSIETSSAGRYVNRAPCNTSASPRCAAPAKVWFIWRRVEHTMSGDGAGRHAVQNQHPDQPIKNPDGAGASYLHAHSGASVITREQGHRAQHVDDR